MKLFHIYFLISCLMVLFFSSSRNNTLTVYIAAVSVLMNYRSTFYGFRNSHLGSESTSRLLFLNPLPRKEMGSKATRVFANDVLCSDHSPFALCPFTSQALEAPRTLLLNLLFLMIDKGAMHLLVFRRRQRLLTLAPLLGT